MKETNSIEYNDKVLNFMAMTETGDPEVATKYLEAANWDETTAVNNFFSKIKVNNNFNNIMKDEQNMNNSNNNKILNKNLINNNENINIRNNNKNIQENEGFISKYILSPLRAILGACLEKREVDLEEEERIFHLLPNKVNDTRKFCECIRRKVGIIVFYSGIARNASAVQNPLATRYSQLATSWNRTLLREGVPNVCCKNPFYK